MKNYVPRPVLKGALACSVFGLVSGVAWLAFTTEYLVGGVCLATGLVGCIWNSALLTSPDTE